MSFSQLSETLKPTFEPFFKFKKIEYGEKYQELTVIISIDTTKIYTPSSTG